MTIRELPTLAVSTVIVVAARNALFLVRGQLSRSRSEQAVRIAPSKSATKLTRQIMPVPLGNLRFLLVSMLLGNRAMLGGMSPMLLCRIARLEVVSSQTRLVNGF